MSHVSPLLKSTITFRSEGRNDAIFSPPSFAQPRRVALTTTDVVVPGVSRPYGEPESRTPDWICLSGGSRTIHIRKKED